jgi:hypothetical protein
VCPLVGREAIAADPVCHREPLAQFIQQNRGKLGVAIGGTAVEGTLLLHAVKHEKMWVALLTAAMLGKEIYSLAKEWKEIEICAVSQPFAKALGTTHLSLVGPPGLTERIAANYVPPTGAAPRPPTPSAASTPLESDIFKKIDLLTKQPKPLTQVLPATPGSTHVGAVPPQAPPPGLPPPSWWTQASATVTGSVIDADFGYPLGNAIVRFTIVEGPALGNWWSRSTFEDGTFALSVPGGKYMFSVFVPGYHSYSSVIEISSEFPRRLPPVKLAHQSPSCKFTVFNRTGWWITLYFDDGGPPGRVRPWSSISYDIKGTVRIGPVAEFIDAPPLRWEEVPADCYGPGYANLWP